MIVPIAVSIGISWEITSAYDHGRKGSTSEGLRAGDGPLTEPVISPTYATVESVLSLQGTTSQSSPTNVKSPSNGSIKVVNVKVGDTVVPGQPLLVIAASNGATDAGTGLPSPPAQSSSVSTASVLASGPASTSQAVGSSTVQPPAPLLVVRATNRGTVTFISPRSAVVNNGDPVATILDPGWNIAAGVTPASAQYRLTSAPLRIKAAITGGPAGFPCTYRGLTTSASDTAAATPPPSGSGGLSLICAIPSDVKVIAGLQATIGIVTAEAPHALTLPLSSVIGANGQGQVVVVDSDGSHHVQTIILGIQDGNNIEVSSGLTATARVLERPTAADFGDTP
jgi:macrolide-specific efflux system membrane fusion protein